MASLAPTPAVIDMGRPSTPVPPKSHGDVWVPEHMRAGKLVRGHFRPKELSDSSHAVGFHPKAGPNFSAMSVRICT